MALALVSLPASSSEKPFLVADLATETVEASTYRVTLAATDDAFLFLADDGRRGRELWISDGTSAGTRLWAEVCPGECRPGDEFDRSFGEVVFDGERAFFTVDDGIHGLELWTSDGSAPGTRLVADLCPGSCDANILNLTLIDQHLYFHLMDSQSEFKPWISNGEAGGTRSLGDLPSGTVVSTGGEFLPFGDEVVFQGFTAEHGSEWWATDGTPDGTRRLTDLCPGECSAFSPESVAFGDGVLFLANVSGAGEKLYGLFPGKNPVVLADLCGGTSCKPFGPLQVLGDNAYVTRAGRLWSTDGSVSGTDFRTLLPPGVIRVDGMVQLTDGTVLVLAKQLPFDTSLWRLNGNQLVGPLLVGDSATSIVAVGDQGILVEAAQTSIDLWRSDGTVEGTVKYDQLPAQGPWRPFAHPPVVLGEQVVFGARFRSDLSLSELVTTRGQTGDSQRLLTVEERPGSSRPTELSSAGSRVVFRSDEGDRHLDDLWSADDFGQTNRLLTDVEPTGLTSLELADGPRVFLTAFDSDLRNSPWLTDGTLGGTVLLLPEEEQELYKSREPVALNGELFFLADQGGGQKLWKSDGTMGSVELVVDLNPSWVNIHEGCPVCSPPVIPTPIFPRDLQVMGGEGSRNLVFVGGAEATGSELWRSDGTTEGTTLLFDLWPGADGSEPENLMPAGDGVVFTADVGEGRNLWSWSGEGPPVNQGTVGDILASASWDGAAVWLEQRPDRTLLRTSDGTVNGTRDVGSLAPGTVTDDELAVANNRAFFVASGELGAELWVSDLSPDGQGPRQVADIWPGSPGSFPQYLRNLRGFLFFSADDSVHGRELWRLNTRSSVLVPVRLGDVAPGVAPSSPTEPALMIPQRPELEPFEFAFFAADDGTTGRELWLVDLPTDVGECSPNATTLCLQNGRFRVSVSWRDDVNGTQGIGRSIPATNDSGYFWFFDAANLELAVKVIDGRESNGAFWFYFGALSDVFYEIEVDDLLTGVSQTYVNPQGNLCGRGDTQAFPEIVGFDASVPVPDNLLGAIPFAAPTPTVAEVGHVDLEKSDGGCAPSDTRLCLLGRFAVSVDWRDHSGNTGQGRVASRGFQTGLMWFFDPGNIELAIKAIDGTAENGAFWLFYGALSDVEYTLRVVDLVTGDEKIYNNAAGNLCGRGDTSAFPQTP